MMRQQRDATLYILRSHSPLTRKSNPVATLDDLHTNPTLLEAEPQPVLLRYEDAYHYQQVFDPLVQLEADTDRELKEGQRTEGVSVRWEQGLNRKWTAYFVLPSLMDNGDVRLNGGFWRVMGGPYTL